MVHERLLFDIAAGLRHLKERGFERIVLLGEGLILLLQLCTFRLLLGELLVQGALRPRQPRHPGAVPGTPR